MGIGSCGAISFELNPSKLRSGYKKVFRGKSVHNARSPNGVIVDVLKSRRSLTHGLHRLSEGEHAEYAAPEPTEIEPAN